MCVLACAWALFNHVGCFLLSYFLAFNTLSVHSMAVIGALEFYGLNSRGTMNHNLAIEKHLTINNEKRLKLKKRG